jgi:hypothetical protein
MSMRPAWTSVRRKRAGADELLEQLDHFRLAGNFSIRKELTADDHKMLRIPKWRPALPLAFGARIYLSFSFSPAGMDRPSTIMLCRVVQGSSLRSFAFSRLRRRTPDPSAFSEKPLRRRARDPAARRAVSHSLESSVSASNASAQITVLFRRLGTLILRMTTYVPAFAIASWVESSP